MSIHRIIKFVSSQSLSPSVFQLWKVPCVLIQLNFVVVPDPPPPSRPLPPTPRDDPRQAHKVSTPPTNHQTPQSGVSSGGSGGQSAPQRNSHVFKPMVSDVDDYCIFTHTCQCFPFFKYRFLYAYT